MKKQSTEEFQTRLWEAVQAIEQNSQVEIVVITRARSDPYLDIPLIWGIVGALLSFSYLMFAPALFEDWLIYGAPVAGFALAYAIASIPLVTRLSATQRRRMKNVEIVARALFQKGGIQHTLAKTGLLIYCSKLEKIVYLVPDRGVEMALPAEEWRKLRAEFQSMFTNKNPNEALVRLLHYSKAVFNRYLPPLENDINELPDTMEIDL
ncbi:MAG: TPM domain-containing protein [Methylococcales bacterium]